MKEKLIIVDAYNLLFSAYFALPELTYNDLPVGAVYGFLNILLKHIRIKPEYLIITADTGKSTFREEIFADYKANRPPIPCTLTPQFSLLRECMDALELHFLQQDGFEADDIIATLVHKFSSKNLCIEILSSDKDLMQLISENVVLISPIKNKIIGIPEVQEKFGVLPHQVSDLLALVGDASDNIPGVPGIGLKTAAKLLNQFGTIDGIKLDEVSPIRVAKLIQDNHDKLTISRRLVELNTNVQIERTLQEFLYLPNDQEKVMSFLYKYGFKNLIPNLINHNNTAKPINIGFSNVSEFHKSVQYGGIVSVYKLDNDIILNAKAGQISVSSFSDEILSIFSDLSVIKVFHSDNIDLLHYLNSSFDDLKVMGYALSTTNTELSDLFARYLEKYLHTQVAEQMRILYQVLKDRLYKEKLFTLYYSIDKPLLKLVHGMQNNGILLNHRYLKELQASLSTKIATLEEKIFEITGHKFIIGSTKQLGEVLFEKMALPIQKKLKNGSPSTDSEVLEHLSYSGYPIADELISWRHNMKLKSTYVDPLIKRIEESGNKRICTTYSTTGTLTGRLSSANPNLQNIPRIKEMRRIFTSEQGKVLLCADYSQIELRVLAYIANVSELQKALVSGEDLHTITAKKIFKTDNITNELRTRAKAVNFGIVYGITGFGLAKQLLISKEEANSYINEYFKEYPEILDYMQRIKEEARAKQYIKTITGRTCPISNIASSNPTVRHVAERSAINAPIQGTAADIIRMAMVKISHYPELNRCMIMQVHDELVFEIPDHLLEKYATNIAAIMEKASPIPMVVDFKFGKTLGDLEQLTIQTAVRSQGAQHQTSSN